MARFPGFRKVIRANLKSGVQEMAGALGVEAIGVTGSGHLVPLENPGAVADALRATWDAARR